MKYLKNNGDWAYLTNRRTGQFLADSTLYNIFSGSSGLKHFLVTDDEIKKFENTRKAARKLNELLPSSNELESIPLEQLRNRSSEIQTGIHEAEKATGMSLRELMGLDKALQRIQTELTNNVAKLAEIDKRIKYEEDKLNEMQNQSQYTDEMKEVARKRIEDLKEERKVRLEIASQNKKELQTQVSRLKQTIYEVLDSDSSLGEKIRTIFREQGITIAAVLTALGLLISTIIGFVTGGGGAAASSTPPKKPSKNWLEKNLKALARLMGKLAEKFGAALPGIIGSIVSWLLNRVKDVIGFAAEHIYIFVAFIISIIFSYFYKNKK